MANEEIQWGASSTEIWHSSEQLGLLRRLPGKNPDFSLMYSCLLRIMPDGSSGSSKIPDGDYPRADLDVFL
ncbi:MAG: hypothetical protein RIE73_07830 [Coleofasciculus sp. C1-SOL-03]|uniref:hypothetical protein n=1 Tax=Coleofasciculus sp. C1-SOL-03 TaxID=3069522 RepID=UPI0032F4C733